MEQEHICEKVKSRTKRLSNRICEDRVGQAGKEEKVENREVQKWGGFNTFHRNKFW